MGPERWPLRAFDEVNCIVEKFWIWEFAKLESVFFFSFENMDSEQKNSDLIRLEGRQNYLEWRFLIDLVIEQKKALNQSRKKGSY